MSACEQAFGFFQDQAVCKYILTNSKGSRAGILNLGGIIQEFSVLQNGGPHNLVVHFDDAQGYIENPFQINKQIGRVAGRIKGAAFEINGQAYQVEANEGKNALHGGNNGLSTQLFDAAWVSRSELVLSTRLQQVSDGYPNDLDVSIHYHLADDNSLKITYRATALGDTVFDPTMHIYWRLPQGLAGARLAMPDGQHMQLDAERLPTGLSDGGNALFDFSDGQDLAQAVSALRRSTTQSGFDEAYRVRPDLAAPVAVLDTGEGFRVNIFSNRNGLVVFTAAPKEPAQHDAGDYDALATEAQTLPDSLHHPEFGNIRLNKGECKEAVIIYQIEMN